MTNACRNHRRNAVWWVDDQHSAMLVTSGNKWIINFLNINGTLIWEHIKFLNPSWNGLFPFSDQNPCLFVFSSYRLLGSTTARHFSAAEAAGKLWDWWFPRNTNGLVNVQPTDSRTLYHFRLMQTIRGVQEKIEASTDRHPFFVPFFLQYLLGIQPAM
jgi:hypothetical protein